MPELTEKMAPYPKQDLIADFTTIVEKYQRQLVAIWFGGDWNPRPERRTLASYLEHRDYFSLWYALKKPEEQKRLLTDSVSILSASCKSKYYKNW